MKRAWLWGEGISSQSFPLSSLAPFFISWCQWCVTSWQGGWPKTYGLERHWQTTNPSSVRADWAGEHLLLSRSNPSKCLGEVRDPGSEVLVVDCQKQGSVVSYDQSRAAALKNKTRPGAFLQHTQQPDRDWAVSWGSAEISSAAL